MACAECPTHERKHVVKFTTSFRAISAIIIYKFCEVFIFWRKETIYHSW